MSWIVLKGKGGPTPVFLTQTKLKVYGESVGLGGVCVEYKKLLANPIYVKAKLVLEVI